MPREFISEYGLDPGDYMQRLVDHVSTRCPKFSEQIVEEAIFVDDGPLDFLVWFALDNYRSHTFFYQDDDPTPEVLEQFIFLSPSKREMSQFKTFLREHYSVYRELETVRLLELPDTYLPQLGDRPRANLGVCHEPSSDRIVFGLSCEPRIQEQEILEDADKIVPAKNLEKFVSQAIQSVHTQIKEDADRHTIAANVRKQLEQDPDFRYETTKSIPKGIHPKYTGEAAELWQKPASRVDYMVGSQGFLQIWIPVDEEEITLVSATAGEYDRDAIVDAIRKDFEGLVV
ncbi:hypothetical protein [Halegenticoccus soli]|uniref:hypothetical protein n=1 Tax=Halegenticoccus soli TaxID=1985678 RepID=UPI000C6E1EE6|nr:hypothetical protein [Halegenticoccus soli]